MYAEILWSAIYRINPLSPLMKFLTASHFVLGKPCAIELDLSIATIQCFLLRPGGGGGRGGGG